MAPPADPLKQPQWMHELKHGGPLPLQDPDRCSHGWSSPPGNTFHVRAADYPDTKLKIPAPEQWLLQPLAFDWIKSSTKICNIMRHPHSRVRAAMEEARRSHPSSCGKPFVWAFNLQIPSKDNHSLVFYYVSFEQPPRGSLMQRFLDGDNSFRNSRLKLLANVSQGPWIVKTAVGERGVCLLGRAITLTYIRDEQFMEIDADIGSSMVANAVVLLAFGYVTSLTVDLAFVLEGQKHDELPERVLAAIKFANLDAASASSLDASPGLEDAREKPRPSRRFWRSVSSLLHAGQHDPVANVEEDDDDEPDQQAGTKGSIPG